MDNQLTQYSKGSGCGCKLSPKVLAEIIRPTKSETLFNQLLVGNHTNDDAAVWDLQNGTSLISTVDFFTPIVNDAFVFGQIAAANALSDVYAMGGKPMMATAILGWPVGKLPLEVAQQVLEGAQHICAQAGIPIAGGHSIETTEPLFGLSVNGLVNTLSIKRNTGAQVGDYLFVTKPIGIGILAAAHKRGIILPEHDKALITVATQLNLMGEKLSNTKGVNALTDITGFGLLGHLHEVCKGSNVGAELYLKNIPLIEGIQQYMDQFCYPDATTTNFNAYKDDTDGLNSLEFMYLCDPQTSGGLLVSVAPDSVDEYLKIAEQFDTFGCATKPIGIVVEGNRVSIFESNVFF
ncbi:MAG: selenide, water dikinase SelD [Bacteroidia bacterium]|jgi:selenide,water dikinase|nr:selenide, water dikinase SelD [Bacteroidia bacterium]